MEKFVAIKLDKEKNYEQLKAEFQYDKIGISGNMLNGNNFPCINDELFGKAHDKLVECDKFINKTLEDESLSSKQKINKIVNYLRTKFNSSVELTNSKLKKIFNIINNDAGRTDSKSKLSAVCEALSLIYQKEFTGRTTTAGEQQVEIIFPVVIKNKISNYVARYFGLITTYQVSQFPVVDKSQCYSGIYININATTDELKAKKEILAELKRTNLIPSAENKTEDDIEIYEY